MRIVNKVRNVTSSGCYKGPPRDPVKVSVAAHLFGTGEERALNRAEYELLLDSEQDPFPRKYFLLAHFELPPEKRPRIRLVCETPKSAARIESF